MLTAWLWVKGTLLSEQFRNLHIKSLLFWDIRGDEATGLSFGALVSIPNPAAPIPLMPTELQAAAVPSTGPAPGLPHRQCFTACAQLRLLVPSLPPPSSVLTDLGPVLPTS